MSYAWSKKESFVMHNYLFTSESVAQGHPDKVADQISDAILDSALAQDQFSRVACETMVAPGLVIVAGEITTKAKIDYHKVIRDTIKEIGYDDPLLGFNYRSCGILLTISKQSPDIAKGVDENIAIAKALGAGDQGLMFGYATDETTALMPMPIALAHCIARELVRARTSKEIDYLKPDGKTQVTVEYSPDHIPVRVHTVVLSTQHSEGITQDRIQSDMIALIKGCITELPIDDKTIFHVNPTGSFVLGGPSADSGLTGRKIIVDTYGGMGRHGGGAFSGKDPTKVDRSACYAARYVAKNVVAAKIAKKCEIQISYAIGLHHPLSLKVDTFGTSMTSDLAITRAIEKTFDLSPAGIIEMLSLRQPIYQKTAFGGHFGRLDPDFTWEKTDRVQALLSELP
jgi:S-adenosylmethionine synthetase